MEKDLIFGVQLHFDTQSELSVIREEGTYHFQYSYGGAKPFYVVLGVWYKR